MAKPLKSLAKSKATNDLFGASELKGRAALKVASRSSSAEAGYTARDIEVLEGLEPVRRRPGMYIGGTDEKALHHLFAEVIDNAMDEALAGHASFIEVDLAADGTLAVTDNGLGIPVVNALSERLEVEVALGGQLYRQVFERGIPKSGLEKLGRTPNRRGTKVRFKPDHKIFGDKVKFNPQRLFKMARAKAYLFGG